MVMLLLLATLLGPAAHAEPVSAAFPPPPGATRVSGSAFGAWLGQLPLYPVGREVLSYTGEIVPIGAARVVDMPVGTRDLQQCADSALRLRATWQRATGGSPAFHYTSGYVSAWKAWAAGTRPKVSGSKVSAVAGAAAPSTSDAAFEAWMVDLFTYAGTRSLPLDTVAVTTVMPGDIVVAPGSPGHAVVVLDVATDGARTWVLVGQGYMPAMDFHVVDGPAAGWFPVEGDILPTAPIALPWSGLRRWK
jgi:hypothetical protein